MGRLESNFIAQLIRNIGDIQPLADNCTKIFVWHTKTDHRIPNDVANPNPGDSLPIYNKIKEEV